MPEDNELADRFCVNKGSGDVSNSVLPDACWKERPDIFEKGPTISQREIKEEMDADTSYGDSLVLGDKGVSAVFGETPEPSINFV